MENLYSWFLLFGCISISTASLTSQSIHLFYGQDIGIIEHDSRAEANAVFCHSWLFQLVQSQSDVVVFLDSGCEWATNLAYVVKSWSPKRSPTSRVLSTHNIKMAGLPPGRIPCLPHPIKDNLSLKLPGIYSIPPGVKWQGNGANHLTPPSTRIENG